VNLTPEAHLIPGVVERRARHLGRLPFAFGPRALLFMLAGFAWMIPVFVDVRFVRAMIAWDLLILALWLVDLWLLPKPADLVVRRTWHAPAALSVESTVELAVINESHRVVRVKLLDAIPSQLRGVPPQVMLTVGPNAEARSEYAVRPMTRGPTPIGAAYLRYQTTLGFAERWAIADVAQTIVTYPNLVEARRHSVYLIRSRQIALEKRSSRIRGAGSAFESLREYREGDELRNVCWTASARRGKPVTRVFEIERSQSIWMLVDSGRLMRARVGGLSKLDYAVNAALALAQVALGSGDQVGLLAYGRRIEQRAPAARGAAHLRRLVNQLAAVREDEGEADHVLAAGRLLADQKRRGLVVWITDLAETARTPEVVRAAAHLMTRHVVLFVVIGDLELQALARTEPDNVETMFENAAAQEVVQRREVMLAGLRERGALALETQVAGLSLAVVNGYLEVKQRNRI
jgi:uncharacterized protein (DUF58 family)